MDFNSWLEQSTKELSAKLQPKPECTTCEDTGQGWTMVCYGGPPIEVLVYCVDCGGDKAGEPVHER